MSTLMLKFVISLEKHDIKIPTLHSGPLFHRWLPNGEKDAIVLDTEDQKAKLKVWFERLGFVANGSIKFDSQQRNVDPEIMATQAILDGGPLFGVLEIQGLSEEELTCIKENKIGSDAYIKLGKRVVKKLIYPPIQKFLEILRTNYGQYWIQNLREWDSRRESLGSYCHTTLRLKWSLDSGVTWNLFEPDERVMMMTVSVSKEFAGYLTEKDWKELAEVAQKGYEPTLANQILSRAHEFMDQGNLKYALIEGVTVLELAISDFIKKNLFASTSLLDNMKSFWEIPLRAQMISVAAISGKATIENIEKAVEAINIRNKVVHDGLEPSSNAADKIRGLLNATAALVSGPKFRFLTANPGNLNQPVENWEKIQKSSGSK